MEVDIIRAIWAAEPPKHDIELDPEVKQNIAEWIEEIPIQERTDAKTRYLLEEIERTRTEFFAACKAFAARTDDFTYWSEENLKRLEKKLYKLEMGLKIVKGKVSGITPERIALARQYPIDRLLQVRQGMARCPFHRDKTASMDVRKNFYHCYSCQQHGDVIDLVMKRDQLSFKQAIEYLT